MRRPTLPATYAEASARFLEACARSGVGVDRHPITARGPGGDPLSIDVARLGAPRSRRLLVVLSGVHGVEGFAPSALQSDFVERHAGALPGDLAVVVIHAVNPWGMAWGRRQNETNVDLNRNWRRDELRPPSNPAYATLHPLVCPETEGLPSVDDILVSVADLVAERGLGWVRDGLNSGQYEFPDGLYFGGGRTEESCRILQDVVAQQLVDAERVVAIDLHTGHGPRGALTALSDQPQGSVQDRFLRSWCERVVATVGDPEAATGPKRGQIASGFRAELPDAQCFATALELGTADDLTLLRATIVEQWVHRHGDRSDAAHAEEAWRYRCCFTPDERGWEALVLAEGARHLDAALAATRSWEG